MKTQDKMNNEGNRWQGGRVGRQGRILFTCPDTEDKLRHDGIEC